MQSPLVPALVAAAAVALLWILSALSETRSERRLSLIARAFRAYAGAHGLASEVGPPLVRGEVQGVPLELTVRRSTRALTSVEATLPGVSNEFVLIVRRRRWRLPRAFEGRRIEEAVTGNKPFDAAFAVLSNEPDLARSLVDRRLAQVVLGFPRAFVDLGARDNRFVLRWRGMETDEAVLDAAVEVVFTACRRRA